MVVVAVVWCGESRAPDCYDVWMISLCCVTLTKHSVFVHSPVAWLAQIKLIIMRVRV